MQPARSSRLITSTPSHLELRLTATDAGGLTDVESIELDPQTVNLTFASSPAGLQLVVGSTAATAPVTRTVIIGSTNTVSAVSPQSLGPSTYSFASWSDGGAQTHTITAPGDADDLHGDLHRRARRPSSLVAAYSFDAGSGTTLADVSGRGHNGTIAGAAWSTAGRNGGALSFDGVNDMVTVADTAALDLTNAMTLEAWVRPSTTNRWRTVALKEQPGALVYSLYSNNSGQRASTNLWLGSGEVEARSAASLPTNAWTHLAATYDGAVIRLYVNGALSGSATATGSMPASTGAFRIGGNTVWDEYFGGLIDDLRLYNRALSAAEIQTDMAAPVGPPPPTDSQPPAAPGTLTATGGLSSVTLDWDGGERQRRRRPLQRPPQHDGRLHAVGGEPDRPAHRDGLHGQRARAGHVLLPRHRRGRRRQRRRRLEPGHRGRHRRCHAAGAPGNAAGHGSARIGEPDLGRGERQRRRRPLQRPPLDRRRLHARASRTGSRSRRERPTPT